MIPQTTFVLTFWPHIISELGGVLQQCFLTVHLLVDQNNFGNKIPFHPENYFYAGNDQMPKLKPKVSKD